MQSNTMRPSGSAPPSASMASVQASSVAPSTVSASPDMVQASPPAGTSAMHWIVRSSKSAPPT